MRFPQTGDPQWLVFLYPWSVIAFLAAALRLIFVN